MGTVVLIFSAWIRYAGTARSLSPSGKDALLTLAAVCIISTHDTRFDMSTDYFCIAPIDLSNHGSYIFRKVVRPERTNDGDDGCRHRWVYHLMTIILPY